MIGGVQVSFFGFLSLGVSHLVFVDLLVDFLLFELVEALVEFCLPGETLLIVCRGLSVALLLLLHLLLLKFDVIVLLLLSHQLKNW